MPTDNKIPRPATLNPASDAGRRAHMRYILRVHGVDRRCPVCDAAPGETCRKNPGGLLAAGPDSNDGPVYCVARKVNPVAEAVWTNGIILCKDDADYDRFVADLEPMRAEKFAHIAIGPAPVWNGYADTVGA